MPQFMSRYLPISATDSQANPWSCTSSLRVIPVARKRGIMPPFHHRVRGQRDDLRPIFLPTAAGGTAVAVPDASWYVAIRARHAWLDPTPTAAATAQALQRPAAVSWPHPQAPLCRL